jgi:integrase
LSIHRRTRKDGSTAYLFRWREGAVNRSLTFDRHADARAFRNELRRRHQLGPLATQQLTERHGPTLGQWIEQRWAPEHGETLAQSTRERYAEVYATHCAALDGLPLAEITVGRLRAWQAERTAAGVQPGSIRKARALLSSILRHAAESEAIPINPMSLVRPPAAGERDAVVPLAPPTVERIRAALLDPQPREVAANARRGRYTLHAVGTPQTRQRDALIVSALAYSGLRPGELRALRWSDVGENTILVQRGTNPDGSAKPLKAGGRRSVRLLPALAQDLREYRLAAGRPPASALILSGENGTPWTKTDWRIWRGGRWAHACRTAGLDPVPRPYDLRHSFASLLLAEGRQPIYVARQLGHSVSMLLSTYGHLFAEYEDDRERIDAEREIAEARCK